MVLGTFALLLLLLAGPARADGKFYHEAVPPAIPYQRAFIICEDDEETLLLQSKYLLPAGAKGGEIGWVVPVPSVPELASMPADSASDLFWELSYATPPEVLRVKLVVAALGFALCAAAIVVWAVRRKSFWGPFLLLSLLIILAAKFLPMLETAGHTGLDVAVLKAEQVGAYEVRVVEANKPEDLVEWLRENGFAFQDADTDAFQDYIERGWCFVVAQIRGSESPNDTEVVSEGLVAPLIMRFSTDSIVYPLVLTSLAGSETKVLIYTLAAHKLTCGQQLELRSTGRFQLGLQDLLRNSGHSGSPPIEPGSFFAGRATGLHYVCKFRGTLTPQQMSQDLQFERAPDDTPYRERLITW